MGGPHITAGHGRRRGQIVVPGAGNSAGRAGPAAILGTGSAGNRRRHPVPSRSPYPSRTGGNWPAVLDSGWGSPSTAQSRFRYGRQQQRRWGGAGFVVCADSVPGGAQTDRGRRQPAGAVLPSGGMHEEDRAGGVWIVYRDRVSGDRDRTARGAGRPAGCRHAVIVYLASYRRRDASLSGALPGTPARVSSQRGPRPASARGG